MIIEKDEIIRKIRNIDEKKIDEFIEFAIKKIMGVE
jgi:hypothetical protein